MGDGMNYLYLASKSKSRKKLLELAEIPYKIIEHESDECGIKTTDNFNEYVLEIARHKMEKIVLPKVSPSAKEKNFFVLTADTLIQTQRTKKILGKPKDRNDAEQMLQMLCAEPIKLVTACCLHQKNLNGTIKKREWTTTATIEFCVGKYMIEKYFEKMPEALNACGAGIIENFGLNFLKKIDGSFTAVLGLPLFELRKELKKIGFS
jgi:septum formation protein